MADSFVFLSVSGGLQSVISDIESIPANIRIAAARAVNRTSERARTASAREMRGQVNFPARYLSSADGRLSIVKKASADDLEAVIRGRGEATSLARFITGGQKGKGVRVEVKPGVARYMSRTFTFKLKNGNTGLAIRTSGGPPKGAYKPKKLSENLYLLYGPSVDQVFRSVAEDVAEPMADFLEREFNRLLDLGSLN